MNDPTNIAGSRTPVDLPADNLTDRLTHATRIPIGQAVAGAERGPVVGVPAGNALVTGRRGSGKSVFLQNLLAGYARTIDTLSWAADDGGALAAPWVSAAATGQVDVTGVDWAASTPGGLEKMLASATRIIVDRHRNYQRDILRHAVDTGRALLPINPKRPAIVLIADLADPTFAEQHATSLLRVLKTGPAAGVFLVLASQYNLREFLGDAVQNAIDYVAVFGMKDEAEMESLVGYHRNPLVTEYMNGHQIGDFLLRTSLPERVRWVQGYQSYPRRMGEVAAATQDRRPTLDESSMYAAGDDYRNRWMPSSDGGQMLNALRQ